MIRDPSFYLGKPVRSLQTMLRQISEWDRRILPVVPDGRYGRNTYASVQSFQQAYGLPATGIADPDTWKQLADTYELALRATEPAALILIWPSDLIIEPGFFHYHVYLVQAMLAALGTIFDELRPMNLSGVLDENTSENLKWVQRAGGLDPSGRLDLLTWRTLHDLYRTMTLDEHGDKSQK